jgi:hypothetical protein
MMDWLQHMVVCIGCSGGSASLTLRIFAKLKVVVKPPSFLILAFYLLPVNVSATPEVMVVLGAPGTENYEKKFSTWAASWKSACAKGGALYTEVSMPKGKKSSREQLREWIAARISGKAALWIILVGHGTFDGENARFNLRGPDVSAAEFAGWLKPVNRPLVLVNTASSSAPFISALSGKDRVVVTATRSGSEQNFARFGEFLSLNIGSVEADLDKDGQTSVLEAFLVSARQVADFYKKEGRLATEHPLLDDNGDQLGTPPDWFRGIRPVKKASDGSPDGYRAHQFHLVLGELEKRIPEKLRQERDALELEVYRLRDRKKELPEDEYYLELEIMLRKISQIYEQAESS